ncbi:MAG: LicD family protein [Lachnospiraceae bacterium]|nr:LicD family protein [Lachnospiraceae bacterium]
MVDLKITLPDGFLDEEIRCGYTVTHERKEVWAVELDLLAELLRVCKKHHIKIFASGGTMLGAVRHKGFIPWDDDIDMMMFRDDYEKLCKVGKDEFKEPYFFQTEYTDRGSLRGHAQLRNSQTTGILIAEKKCDFSFNQGIFIDIFPLDSVSDEKVLLEKQEKKVIKYKKMALFCSQFSTRYMPARSSVKNLLKKVIYLFFNRFMNVLSLKYYKKFENECAKYNCNQRTKYISTLSFQFENRQHFKLRRDYEKLIDLPFEFMYIPVGERYDEALTNRYGDYHKFVMEDNCHGGIFFDTNKSYKEYCLND